MRREGRAQLGKGGKHAVPNPLLGLCSPFRLIGCFDTVFSTRKSLAYFGRTWEMRRRMYSYLTPEGCLGKVAVSCHCCLILCGDFRSQIKNSSVSCEACCTKLGCITHVCFFPFIFYPLLLFSSSCAFSVFSLECHCCLRAV